MATSDIKPATRENLGYVGREVNVPRLTAAAEGRQGRALLPAWRSELLGPAGAHVLTQPLALRAGCGPWVLPPRAGGPLLGAARAFRGARSRAGASRCGVPASGLCVPRPPGPHRADGWLVAESSEITL